MFIFRGIGGDRSLTLMYKGLQAPPIKFFLGELPQKLGELKRQACRQSDPKRSKNTLKKTELPHF